MLRRVLLLLCEQLGMDLAYITTVEGESRTVRIAVASDGGTVEAAEGLTEPLSQSWCGHVLAAEVLLVADAAAHPVLLALPSTTAFGIASHVGVALRGPAGEVLGTLCALGHEPHRSLNERDAETLRALAEVVAPLVALLDSQPAPLPRQRRGELAAVADLVVRAEDLEQLTRPLLEALHDITGLSSTYLTVIHEQEDVQELRYTYNHRPEFQLPEGLVVPWGDTLCKRALEEGRPCTSNVPEVWGDSDAARALALQSYVSVPVSLSSGALWGTLCAADDQIHEGTAEHLPTMRLFALLISSEIERAAAVDGERAKAEQARQEADTDVLTSVSSRRVLLPWLATNLGDLERDEQVAVVFLDVDAFKAVNDRHGHAAGDAVLVELARRLRAAGRPGDLVVRLGGDEFVVAARLTSGDLASLHARITDAAAFPLSWLQGIVTVRCSVGSASADSGTAEELLAAADVAMYAAKPR